MTITLKKIFEIVKKNTTKEQQKQIFDALWKEQREEEIMFEMAKTILGFKKNESIE